MYMRIDQNGLHCRSRTFTSSTTRRVVGTYTFKKDLAILLYPVAPWNLDEFMDDLMDTQSSVNSTVLETSRRNRIAKHFWLSGSRARFHSQQECQAHRHQTKRLTDSRPKKWP
jgi:hypothetical protein